MKLQWETEELVEHWTLDIEDRTLLGNKTGATHLGFAVLLKFFRQEGRFPQHKNEVPGIVITFLVTQVAVAPEAYLQYACPRHRSQSVGRLSQSCQRGRTISPPCS